jgi:hypothetical protein
MPNKLRRASQGFCLAVIVVLLAVGLVWLHSKGRSAEPVIPVETALGVPSGQHNSYTTNFLAKEEPLDEGAKWISGKSTGVDWSDVRTSAGLAYGTELGSRNGDKAYDDSTSLLTGLWGADQTAEAEVHSTNPSDEDFEEVELRLRSSLSSHNSTGYEVLFRCSKTENAYASIVRWDGPLGKFTYLSQKKGPEFGVGDGDIVKATAVGNVITGYINAVEVIRANDDTYPTGNPGMGFWFKVGSSKKRWFRSNPNVNSDCGFRRFAAWD